MTERRVSFRESILIITITALLAIFGFFGQRLYSSIDSKLDIEVYNHDMKSLNEKLDNIDKSGRERGDMIIKLLREHEEHARNHRW